MSQHSTDSAHFASAPSNLHLDTDQVAVMITKVKDILDKLTSVQMQHLLLIRDSPRYLLYTQFFSQLPNFRDSAIIADFYFQEFKIYSWDLASK